MTQPFERAGATPATGEPVYPGQPVEPVAPGAPSTQDVAKGEAAGVADDAKERAADVAGTAKQNAAQVKDRAKEGAGQVAGTAKEGVGQVAGTAKEGAGHVAGVAKDEARHVAGVAGEHASGLLAQARDELTSQVSQQQSRLSETLHSLGGDLGDMAKGEQPSSGLATDLAGQASTRLDSIAGWLDDRSPADLLDEVRQFARRKPGAFLAIAAVAGLVAGRLTRGIADDKRSDDESQGSQGRSGGDDQYDDDRYDQVGRQQAYPPVDYAPTAPPGEPVARGYAEYGGAAQPAYGQSYDPPGVAQPPYGQTSPTYPGREGQFGATGEVPGRPWSEGDR